MTLSKDAKIVVTGAAGLVGQNLILRLTEIGFRHIIAIDKHTKNLAILKQINPAIKIYHADLAKKSAWGNLFENCQVAILLHAQITGLSYEEFLANNVHATENVIFFLKQYQIPFTIHVSSSVIHSVVNDFYTVTKQQQESLIVNSGLVYCILRPTLMFGWFDPKHFGWLARFMQKIPIFPIPSHGKYIRQPLYSRDFCNILLAAIDTKHSGKIYDIVGQEKIYYIDIIKAIKSIKKCRTKLIKLPYAIFYLLLKCYAILNNHPPFTAAQLKALTAGDQFTGVDSESTFDVKMSSFHEALKETFTHPMYSKISLEK